MYTKTFRVTQPATLKGSTRDGLAIDAVFSYQACDDTTCYAPSTMPISWILKK
jgi:hypothetical protein